MIDPSDLPEAFVAAAQQQASDAFQLLHPGVQRWIWKQGWMELRDIQERSIQLLLEGKSDVVISATTAGGKTEAAFLPIVSRLMDRDTTAKGFSALYVSPLRALINDQFGRLESLCDELEIPVFKWHGDVADSQKRNARRRPDGILLITPESLEALLVRRGSEIAGLFAKLNYVVVDELHAYLDAPRGKQLQSLLHRLEIVTKRRVPRIGLSATLADRNLAAEFLRPRHGSEAVTLEAQDGLRELLLQLRGYVSDPRPTAAAAIDEADKESSGPKVEIARHLFKTIRGSRSLIFANARREVEEYTVLLSEMCERAGVPNEFFAHHGSLSREYREEAERRMKDETLPASIVCTSTLELGIDIGHIDAVAQIGPAHRVSGLRQRLGRSGRRPGKPAVLRIYVTETALTARTHPLDTLRPDIVQAIAMINLMLRKWNEPAHSIVLHLSTLTHQLLALICQYGGITPKQGYEVLIESGVFQSVEMDLYKRLLKQLGRPEVGLLEQAPDGTLLLGRTGERITSSYDFFAVFMTPEEYRVIHASRTIGTIPIVSPVPYFPGSLLIFAGRRWIVEEVSEKDRLILVKPSKGGNPPNFGGELGGLDEVIVKEMRSVYLDLGVPPFLDSDAVSLLAEARKGFVGFQLYDRRIIRNGTDVILFPWVGSRTQFALTLALRGQGLNAGVSHFAIEVHGVMMEDLQTALRRLADSGAPDPLVLARTAQARMLDKYDLYLGDELQTRGFAAAAIEAESLPEVARTLLAP